MAKIVHLTSVCKTFHVRVFEKHCRSLVADGNEVVLLCTHDKDEVVDGVQIKTVGQPCNRLYRMLVTTAKLLKAAAAEDGDLYVIHDPELIPCAWILAKLSKVVIYDMHENKPEQILTKHWIPGPLRSPLSTTLSLVERLSLARMPVIFAESSYAKYYSYIAQSATVLNMPHKGVEAPKFRRPTLGYMGWVSALRGSIVTLDALDLLRRRGVTPDFECIGPATADHMNELRRRVARMKPLNIRLHGYTLPAEGWRRIARCHVGLAVLSNVPNYYESFPGKMFEYMSFGVPVVVSDFPLYREVVDRVKCGICVAPDSPEDIADAVQWLLEHPDEAQAMGARGRAAVESEYNWQVEYDKLAGFYDACLERRNRKIARSHAAPDASQKAA